jgi:hypothetical protein
MGNNNNTGGGMGLGTILFLIFLVLKLTKYIDWSWWWVLSPLWIPFAIIVLVILLLAIFTNGRLTIRRRK